MGSFWYLKVYYILTVLGVLILKFFPKQLYWFIALCFGYTLFINLNPVYYPTGQVGYVAFYLGLFLVAHALKGKLLSKSWFFLIMALWLVVLVTLYYSIGYEALMKMNKAKFPPKLLYIFWSIFSLSILFFFYNRLKINKPNFITQIGNDAIFYYFAQGISSSLVYFVVVSFKDEFPWYVLMVLVFVINVILALVIAQILKKIDAWGWLVLQQLRKITVQ